MVKSKQFLVTIDYQDIEPTEIDLHNVLAQVIRENVFKVREIKQEGVVDVDYQEV